MTAESLSPKLLTYYFEYQYPTNLLVIVFNKKLFKEKINNLTPIYFFIDENRAKREFRVRRKKHHLRAMREILRSRQRAEGIVDADGVSLYRLSSNE
jgi:hypothetical protein